MMDEARTRLYFTIRSLQYFIKKGEYSKENYNNLSTNLKKLLDANLDDLRVAYNAPSTYTIINKIMEKTPNNEKMAAAYMCWIMNGHYKISEEQRDHLLRWYNEQFRRAFNIKLFSERDLHESATEILTYIKPETEDLNLKVSKK